MLISYEVGAVYRIVDQATPTLLKIATELSRIDKLTKSITADFAALGKVNVSGINRSLITLNERLGKIEKTASTAGRALAGDFVKADTSINAAASAAARLTAELNAAKAAGAGLRLPNMRTGGGGGGANTPNGGSSGGHGGNANWQHVGIGLGMGGMIGLHEIKHFGKEMLDAGGEYQHVLTAIKKQNATKEEILAATTAARKLSQSIAGVTETEALEVYGTNRGIFGHKDSLALMKPILEYTQVAGSTTGDYAGASKKVYEMTRAGDLLGKMVNPKTHEVDTEQFKHFLELGSKVTLGTHGKVDASTWLALAQQGGPAMSGMSDKGLVTQGMVAQIMGGHRAGTALTAFFQQMVGGKMTTPVYEELMKYDLAGGTYVTNPKSGKKKLIRGGVNPELQEALKEDPLQAVEVIRKAMENKGVTEIDKQVPILFEILGRQTTQRIVHDLLRNAPQLVGERGRILGSKGIDESRDLQNNEDYKQAEHNLSAGWKNLMIALGQPGVQTAVDAMNGLAKGLNYMASIATANPTATKIVLEGLAGLGVAFAALSVAGVIAGAALLIPGGAVALAVTALVGVFGTIAAFNWKSVGETLTGADKLFNEAAASFGKWFGGIAKTVAESAEALGAEIKTWPSKLGAAIAEMGAGMVTAIGDMLKSLFNKINPFSKTSFEGGDGLGGMIQKASFSTGGGANDNFGGVSGVGRALGQDGIGGAGGGGSGLGSSGGGAGLAHARGVLSRANPEMVAYIRASAIRNGIDPNIALRIAASEGLGGSIPGVRMTPGDKGTSFGPYQLHYGGRGSLGTEYSRATGHHAGDPKHWQEQIDFALRYAGKNKTWAPWFGRGPAGVGTHEGFGYKGQAAPTAGPPPKAPANKPVMVDLHMDGKKMGRAIAMHQADDHLFPKKAGGMDTHGSFRSPGTPVTDAA
jgi:hypothetical protein